MRGEYKPPYGTEPASSELPPRARRIPVGEDVGFRPHGTTSACAENTVVAENIVRIGWNYLRVRGEYLSSDRQGKPLVELPPRARRIRLRSLTGQCCDGTTSACAENTPKDSNRKKVDRNYLRVRGEYHFSSGISRLRAELPPRARRILDRTLTVTEIQGTTSACAENTSDNHNNPDEPRNYLRVRGEYSLVVRRCAERLELPPRARRIPP